MADRNDTREPTRLEQAIESERSKLLQANAVLTCLYEVLLYADGEGAIKYAEAAHVVSTLIEDCVARLDSVRLRPLIEELKLGGNVGGGGGGGLTLRDSVPNPFHFDETRGGRALT